MPTDPTPKTDTPGQATCPQSLVSGWTRIGTFTLAAVTGSGNVVLPTTAQITSNGFTSDAGTLIVLRAMYDTLTTAVTTSASGCLMGRKKGSGDGGWMLLYNRAATPAIIAELNCDPGATTGKDVNDGTFKYTTPDADNVYDAMGCNEFVWLTTTAMATITGGSLANTGVQFKVL